MSNNINNSNLDDLDLNLDDLESDTLLINEDDYSDNLSSIDNIEDDLLNTEDLDLNEMESHISSEDYQNFNSENDLSLDIDTNIDDFNSEEIKLEGIDEEDDINLNGDIDNLENSHLERKNADEDFQADNFSLDEELGEDKISMDSTDELDSLNLDDTGSALGDDNLDLSLEESFNEIDSEISKENFSLDEELNLKEDLGLKDELSLSTNGNEANIDEDLDNFSIDMIDDKGETIEGLEDEFGVDLKQGPITIDFTNSGYSFDDDVELIPNLSGSDSFDDIESETIDQTELDIDEIEERMNNDDEILNISLPEKKPLTIDDEQDEFLKSNSEDDLTSIDDNFTDISSDEEDISLDSDFESEKFGEDSISISEDLDTGLSTDLEDSNDFNDFNIEEMEDEAVSNINDNLVSDDDLLKLSEGTSSEVDLSEDQISDSEIDLARMSEEEINLSDEDDFSDIPSGDSIPTDGDLDLNIDETDDSSLNEINIDDIDSESTTDAISLDETELKDVEDVIFPGDDEMPDIDDEIKNTGLVASLDDASNSISPLTDTDDIFDSDIEAGSEAVGFEEETLSIEEEPVIEELGNVEDINLENIPSVVASVDEEIEEEVIGLSGDELDNILNDTEIIETTSEDAAILDEEIPESLEDLSVIDEEFDTIDNEITDDQIDEEYSVDLSEEPQTIEEESETIDMSSFDADLKQVDDSDSTEDDSTQIIGLSSTEEEEIYNNLRNEMESKEDNTSIQAGGDTEVLKSEVKSVLSYLDQLLDSLPEEKIKEFAESKAFETYRKLFEELNIKN